MRPLDLKVPKLVTKLASSADGLCYFGLVALFLGVYGATLLPGLHEFGDVTKAQFVGRLLGTTHPPGYPLYNLLTWAVSWVPLGSLARRINAFSAACAIGTLLLLFYVQRRELNVGRWSALLSTCAFGFGPTFWEQSVIAEVYTLNSVLVATVVACLLRWRRTAASRWYLAACALYALSFGNHLTVVTLLPAFCYVVFTGDRRVLRSPALVGAVAVSILVGMSLYLYPIWRTHTGALYLEYRIGNFEKLFDYVTGERYRGKMFAFGLGEVLTQRLPRFTGRLVTELGPLALLAAVGAWLCRPSYARTALLLAVTGELLWVLTYDVPDIDIYLIPVALFATVLVGVGLDALGRNRTIVRAFAFAVTALLVFALPAAKGRAPNHHKHVKFTERIDRELAALGEGAVIAGIIHYGPRMAYVHRLVAEGEGQRRRIHLVYEATPKAVADYLRGERKLKDSHTGEIIEPGLRVFVTPRAESAPWHKAGLSLGPRRHGMRRLRLHDGK